MYTLQRKPNQHATRIPRSVRIWSQTIRISRGQRIATFHVVVNRFEEIHCSQEEEFLTQTAGPYLASLPGQPWSSGEKPSFYWQPATRLTMPISPACDRYVQYLLAGANSSILIWHRWRLQSPKGPARSQVVQSHHKPLVKVMWSTYHRPVVFRPLRVYQSLYLRLAIANVI
jgi:hypothetical protein